MFYGLALIGTVALFLGGCPTPSSPGVTPPATPTGLTVGSATTTALSVSSIASTGAASYQVFRDTSSSGSFATMAFDGTTTSFTNGSLASATAYYYKVQATNAGGSSALSAAVSGTTLAASLTVSMVADINSTPSSASSNPMDFVSFGTDVYFSAIPVTSNGAQLMKYDGTNPPSAVSSTANFNPTSLTVFNGTLYMAANSSGSKLFSYDGISAPAAVSTPAVTGPEYLQVFGTDLYFSATGGTYGQELWALSNTSAPAANINTTSGQGSAPAQLVVMNSKLYFSASDGLSDGNNGRQLYSYNGSAASMVGSPITTGIYATADALNPGSPIVVFNNALYFPATADTSTFYLYSSDGTATPAPVAASPLVADTAMVVCNGALFLRSTDGALQKYNGSSFTNLTNGSLTLGTNVTFGVLNNVLYFPATADGTHYDLYKYDGSSVTLVKTFGSTMAQAPGQFSAVNGKLYFQANDGTAGMELWVLH
jgi:ELWxxDGT repeat protein